MSKKLRRLIKTSGCLVVLSAGVWAAEPAAAPATATTLAPDATITSDELQLVDQGAESIFVGNVVLKQDPYILWADRMRQVKATGIVTAAGHVRGQTIKPSGEKVIATGRYARYDPHQETTELWGDATLWRWETQADTMPVHITAERFISHKNEHRMWAKGNVRIHRGDTFWAKSDEAQLDETENVVSLWGDRQAETNWTDSKGTAHFFSDRAMIFQSPRRVRLLDHVNGRILPAS